MPRKIDIELTSARADGTWTWRVAGARQPKGTLDGSLLPTGASVGDVLRAEAEIELEGTVITAVAPPPGKRPDPDRLELLGDTRPFEGVTTSLVPKGAGRPRRDRDDTRRARPDRGDQARGGRDRGDTTPRSERGPSRSERGPEGTPPAEEGRRPREERSRHSDEAGRGAREEARRDDRASTSGRPGDRRPDGRRPPAGRPGGEARRDRESRGTGRGEGDAGAGRDRAASGPPRPKRLSPGSVHRHAVLEALAPEERAVAEQLLQGGIPAVRRALQEQNAHAREEGRPEVKAEPLLALAEELLPRLKAAEWRDRADAAAKDVDEIGLRDLRSIVAGADAGARDDDSRILAKALREALDRREAAARDAWLAEVTTCLDEGRVTRALRVAGRPPDPRSRFPAELATRLGEAASAAMGPDTPPDRWAALLSAVLESPVRRSVKPAGLPATPGEALLVAARQASGRIPALAAMLGLQMPPPPGPRRPPARPTRPGSHPPAPTDRPAPAPPSPPTPGAVPTPAGLPDASAQAPPADASSAAGDDGAVMDEPGGAPDAAQPEQASQPSPAPLVEPSPSDPEMAVEPSPPRPEMAVEPSPPRPELASQPSPAPPAEPSPPEPESATEEHRPGPVSEGGSDRTEATATTVDAENTPLPEVATEPAPPGTNGDAVAQALETAPPTAEHDGP